MKNTKLVVDNDQLSNPYFNSQTNEAYATFFPMHLDSATLYFKLEQMDGEGTLMVTPDRIEYSVTQLATGTKINIEVVANGFIVKTGGETKVTESEWDLRKHIENHITEKQDFVVDYDEEMGFTNLEETIDKILDDNPQLS